jgi:hypothetical protein
MANKNPFELRTDILAMAKDYMDRTWETNLSFTQSLYEAGQKSVDDVQEAMKPYTMESLVEKAKEMYNFISEK